MIQALAPRGRYSRPAGAVAVFALLLILLVLTAAAARADVTGSVRGTVFSHGHSAAGVTVHLTGERIDLLATTDAAGRFAFARVPFGAYTLAAAVERVELTRRIDVTSDSTLDVSLGDLATIGKARASTRAVRGTPVSENALDARRIGALPRNDSLSALVETMPGIVHFSYNEPVAHGFHGITYEIDGAPLPQSTSSNFAELIDPRNIGSLEVFTGAFPAEFGGSRQGAVVNILSPQPERLTRPEGSLTVGAGEFASSETQVRERFSAGAADVAVALNASRTDRGLDAPTSVALHDNANLSDQFVRIAVPAGERNVLAFDASNQYAAFQIPINTRGTPNDPLVSLPGTDDVQREYDRFASLSFTHSSRDGLGFVRIVPWVRTTEIAYDGDLTADVGAFLLNPDGSTTSQNGLRGDRRAAYVGLRASAYRGSAHHAVRAGIDLARETFDGSTLIRIAGMPDFTDRVTHAGSQIGAFFEDRWSPTPALSINPGLRYDHSTGFVSGGALSPRIEINLAATPLTILHAYYGRLYAAPQLEDVRRDAVVTQTSSSDTPVYDLKPETDSYVEFGIAHTFRAGLSGYINAFQRNAHNVLDTTQLANTPLFAVFNNAIGHVTGTELRLTGESDRASFFLSATFSRALAGGVSGSTFLVDPRSASDLTLNPEDHDQSASANAAYTRRFGADASWFATLQWEYGTGFPVAFQNGTGRLPAHSVVNLALGRTAAPSRLSFQLDVENLFDHAYLLKVNNGFNTTQYAPGRRASLRVTAPL